MVVWGKKQKGMVTSRTEVPAPERQTPKEKVSNRKRRGEMLSHTPVFLEGVYGRGNRNAADTGYVVETGVVMLGSPMKANEGGGGGALNRQQKNLKTSSEDV